MANDAYIPDDDLPDESEYEMMLYEQWWAEHKAMKPHDRDAWAKRMFALADEKRKKQRENGE